MVVRRRTPAVRGELVSYAIDWSVSRAPDVGNAGGREAFSPAETATFSIPSRTMPCSSSARRIATWARMASKWTDSFASSETVRPFCWHLLAAADNR